MGKNDAREAVQQREIRRKQAEKKETEKKGRLGDRCKHCSLVWGDAETANQRESHQQTCARRPS